MIWGLNANYMEGLVTGAELFLKRNCIGIGWRSLGDLSSIRDEESLQATLEQNTEAADPADPKWNVAARKRWISQSRGKIWRFLNRMVPGDFVVLPTTHVDDSINVGIVTGSYRHDPSFGREYVNLRDVKWLCKVPRAALSESCRRSLQVPKVLWEIKAAQELKDLIDKHSNQHSQR